MIPVTFIQTVQEAEEYLNRHDNSLQQVSNKRQKRQRKQERQRVITEAMVDAAAEVMWNDRDARYGGAWEHQPKNLVVVVQTRATARAALAAALALQDK